MNTIVLVVLAALGAGAIGTGAWTAVRRRRPGWLPARAITPTTARAWGLATGLAGLGVVILSLNLLGPDNRIVEVVGFLILVAGAAVIVVAPPASRRRR